MIFMVACFVLPYFMLYALCFVLFFVSALALVALACFVQMPEIIRVEYARLHLPLPEELVPVVDRQTIKQTHANILAGACLCLGLRFAGTGDERARTTVLNLVR